LRLSQRKEEERNNKMCRHQDLIRLSSHSSSIALRTSANALEGWAEPACWLYALHAQPIFGGDGDRAVSDSERAPAHGLTCNLQSLSRPGDVKGKSLKLYGKRSDLFVSFKTPTKYVSLILHYPVRQRNACRPPTTTRTTSDAGFRGLKRNWKGQKGLYWVILVE
jgi:hypothetical protein